MPALLEITDLSKDFGGVSAVEKLNLSLADDDLLAIIGPNGCGKTTLFNLITGAMRPSAGSILFNGQEIAGRTPYRIAQLGIARKFQIPGIFPQLTVREHLDVAVFADRGRHGLRGVFQPAGSHIRAEDLLELVGLDELSESPASILSHGQKQWLEIAMVLGTEPQLILLDEPTTGMTEAETAATANLVRRLHQERGVAAIVIEHDLRFVDTLDSPVAFMLRGSIVRSGSLEEIRADHIVRDAYLGSAA